jgi:hypothetical protein
VILVGLVDLTGLEDSDDIEKATGLQTAVRILVCYACLVSFHGLLLVFFITRSDDFLFVNPFAGFVGWDV